ncbi:MAG: hypothetical protein J6T15_04875 [Bacilli bacterium]|nr:hypothetical protein [Bacilli bacterium]
MGLDHGIYIKKIGKGNNKFKDVAYFRKCNQVHGWFLRNCVSREFKDPNEWCGSMVKIEKQDLESLLQDIEKVLEVSKLKKGKVIVDYDYKMILGHKYKRPVKMEGSVIKNPKTAKKLLPCCKGFFFGSYNYDDFYLDQLYDVKMQLIEILKTVDFNKYNAYYWGWW